MLDVLCSRSYLGDRFNVKAESHNILALTQWICFFFFFYICYALQVFPFDDERVMTMFFDITPYTHTHTHKAPVK